jgi:flagellar M-ring protein FliF
MTATLARCWAAIPARTRPLVVGALAVLVGVIGLTLVLQRDTRVSLFAEPLRAEQVEEVAERLADWNVPFAVTADNVRVDGARRNDVLLRLAALGIPRAHLASLDDALAKAGPLTPQSILDAEQLDGRAGDLAAGLRGVAGVEDARVMIAAGRDATFADGGDAHQTTASVRLTLRPGTTLTRQLAGGVRASVAAGVSGLAPERVAILDDRGLAVPEDSGAPDDAAALQTSLQSALDEAFGVGDTIVRVRVMLDPTTTHRRDESRRPLAGPIDSTTTDEHFKSASKQYAKTNAVVERGSETHDESVEIPAGRIQHMSVAVAVDAARGFDLGKIRALALATLGLSLARGDEVTVEAVPFAKDAREHRGLPFYAALTVVASVVPPLIAVVAFLVALRFGAKPVVAACEALVSRIAVERASRALPGYAPAHVRGALANEPPHTAAAIISALPAATATAVLEMYPPEERAAIVKRMSRAAAPAVPDHVTVLRHG